MWPNTKKRLILMSMVVGFSGVLFFQNCSKNQMESTQLKSIDASGDIVVPDAKEPTKPETPNYIEKAQVSKLVANRILTTNIFVSIFGPTIRTVASANIAYQDKDFGSGFSIYESVIKPPANCNTTKNPLMPCVAQVASAQTPSIIGLNVRREAWRLRTCHFAVASEERILFALRKIHASATILNLPAFNEDNLDKAYQLFFRAKPLPNQNLIDSLLIVGQSQNEPVNKWQYVLLALCISPHWQVL